MNKLWTIFKHEYISRVKTKGFIIGTALTPIFLIFLSVGPGLLMSLKTEKSKQVTVIDFSGIVYPELVNSLDDTTDNGGLVDTSSSDGTDSEAASEDGTDEGSSIWVYVIIVLFIAVAVFYAVKKKKRH